MKGTEIRRKQEWEGTVRRDEYSRVVFVNRGLVVKNSYYSRYCHYSKKSMNPMRGFVWDFGGKFTFIKQTLR